ncbi:hypothetical protein DERP_008635 [Dermatophagoides pteronyssinus]|uniref:Uncharacterized protein n=1 Tax=Dermatophagoides pteronyssinus TaxID=6956 RepID=A0ABQ8IWV4_DERPT|nr:hypothetical protein DERP_008635 [Dermatophagoides pteronyssinus]
MYFKKSRTFHCRNALLFDPGRDLREDSTKLELVVCPAAKRLRSFVSRFNSVRSISSSLLCSAFFLAFIPKASERFSLTGGLVGDAIEERRDELAEFDVLLFDSASEFNNVIVGDRFAVNVEDGPLPPPLTLPIGLLVVLVTTELALLILDNPEGDCLGALFAALRK